MKIDNPKKRKLDGKRLSKQDYERRDLAKNCRKFLTENHVMLISDNLTHDSMKKLARYFLRNYKKV